VSSRTEKVLPFERTKSKKVFFSFVFCSLNRTFAARMSILEPFKIDLKELDEGLTQLQFSLGDAYFEAIEAPEVRRGDLQTTLCINRAGDVFTLDFHTEGSVLIPCDLCLDDMEQPIVADNHLTATFGEESSEDDELLVVSEDDGVLDASWLIYEFIALAIPIKHVHAPGKCNVAMTEKLHELSAARSSDADDNSIVDPRWETLKRLKIQN